MKKETKEITTAASNEALELLRQSYPVEQGFTRTMFPRLGLVSQDKTEGKGKAMKVIAEAGTFYTEKQTEELDEDGKKIWDKADVGTSVEGIILFQRKQLRFYDSATETYTSSPIYDTDDEVIPLFCNKQEVDKGTPTELRGREIYKGQSAKGKPISKLEENRILYVLLNDEVYQLNLRGTSMYAFLTYARKTLPPAVLTSFGSEQKEHGSISWSQMTFKAVRNLDAKEIADVQEKINEIKEGVAAEKGFYASKNVADDDMKQLAGKSF
jgi:hypothetical protein